MNYPKTGLYRFIVLCIMALALAACGGGGGGGDSPSPPASGASPITSPPPPQTFFFPDPSALTEAQMTSFDNQLLYFNVHSAANPVGEIRGVIVPSTTAFVTDNGDPVGSNTFSTLLSGDQEVPATATGATGYATVVLDPATRTLSGVVVTHGIVGSASHIHAGAAGVAGPVVFPLEGGPTVWRVPANTVLTDAQINTLATGGYYVNVHSTGAPTGEIRGQLTQRLRFALLNGANETPPNASTASGTGVLSLDPTTNAIRGFVKTTGVTGTVAHIHDGLPGVIGGVAVPLAQTPAGSGIWVVPAGATLTPAQVASFNAGNLYFNVHSAAFPVGEIRGHILAATVKIGNAALDGAQESPAVITDASGTGVMSLNSVTRQVNGNVFTTGIDPTVAHVHEGPAGVIGPVIVPLTLTPPASTLVPPLAISTASLADGSVGTAYSQTLAATGGTPPYAWALASGTLPDGLSLSADGIVSGTPTTVGISSFSVSVTDSASPTATVTRALTITITAVPVAAVSFSAQVQPIFSASCTTACHTTGGIAAFLDLSNAAASFAALVQSVPARVVPGSSGTSILFGRINGSVLPVMPIGLPPLSAADQTLIKDWIDQGAANN